MNEPTLTLEFDRFSDFVAAANGLPVRVLRSDAEFWSALKRSAVQPGQVIELRHLTHVRQRQIKAFDAEMSTVFLQGVAQYDPPLPSIRSSAAYPFARR